MAWNAGPAPTGAVTLVFTDVQGSTRLWERRGELMWEAAPRPRARAALASAGGYEVKSDVDSLMAAFADPAAAVEFCVVSQEALVGAP